MTKTDKALILLFIITVLCSNVIVLTIGLQIGKNTARIQDLEELITTPQNTFKDINLYPGNSITDTAQLKRGMNIPIDSIKIEK